MANYHNNLPFEVEQKEVVLIKPSKPTPFEVLYFSSIDNDLVLELICQTIYVYQANPTSPNGVSHDLQSKIIGKSDHHDPVLVIKDAISKVLVHYYPLAGKLKRDSTDGRLYLTCDGDGVPFLEATANCHLSSLKYLDGVDVEIAKNLVFDFSSESEFGYHPLVFQLTKFACGGFTIGMGLSHSVCDGFGAAQIFTALAEVASGKNEPTVKPVWERERLLVRKFTHLLSLDNPNLVELAKSPYLPTDDILHECFYVNSETIKRLKAKIMKECENEYEKSIEGLNFTTIEVLGAYIWRARFRALKLNPDGKTVFFLTVGIRNHLNPPLPNGYYGNAFVASTSALLGKILNEGKLSETAKLIKDSKRLSCNEKHIWNEIEKREKLRELNIKVEGGNGVSMVLTDWRQLGLLEQADFGWKGAVNIIPVPWNMFGYVDLCIFMPPCCLDPSTKGGVRVLVSLPKPAMPMFKKEMDALLQLQHDIC